MPELGKIGRIEDLRKMLEKQGGFIMSMGLSIYEQWTQIFLKTHKVLDVSMTT